MSQLTDIVDAVVTAIETALTSYKSVDATYTELTRIKPSELPKAMVFNPSLELERLPHKQVDETTTLGVALLRVDGEAAEIRTDVEAVIDQIEGDGGLGAILDDYRVDAVEIDETQSTRTIAVMTVTTRRVN